MSEWQSVKTAHPNSGDLVMTFGLYKQRIARFRITEEDKKIFVDPEDHTNQIFGITHWHYLHPNPVRESKF